MASEFRITDRPNVIDMRISRNDLLTEAVLATLETGGAVEVPVGNAQPNSLVIQLRRRALLRVKDVRLRSRTTKGHVIVWLESTIAK